MHCGVVARTGVTIAHPLSRITLSTLIAHRRVCHHRNDVIVTHNIDDLTHAPTPSFVNFFDSYVCQSVDGNHSSIGDLPSRAGKSITLMAGIAVLSPSATEWERMQVLAHTCPCASEIRALPPFLRCGLDERS